MSDQPLPDDPGLTPVELDDQLQMAVLGHLLIAYPAQFTVDEIATAFVTPFEASFRLSSKSSIRTGRVLRLSGKLTGRSGLKRGVSVLIQANAGRSWRAVTTVRARRDGTWSARYKVPRQLRGRYSFRAIVRPTPSYPYASGTTRSLRLRVR